MDFIIVQKIKLSNFRSHTQYVLECKKSPTLILGENGCGKTSVLEAIYIALRGKSFRAVDREIFKRGTEFYRVEVELFNGEKIIISYDNKNSKKTFLIQDKKFSRLPRKNRYPVVLFLPDDLNLISSSPAHKRDYFDNILAQLDEKYNSNLVRYNKALKQRNELLKSEYVSQETLFSWDVLLAKYGVEIRKARAELVDEINKKLTETYRSIAENKDEININYKSYTGEVLGSEYLRLLTLDYERDKITGHTNFGVHRDDYEFIFNNVMANGNASRGEVRSIVLALKFIEAKLVYEKINKKPVVLLDDVFSELDETRQKCLVKNFQDHQVILTSVDGV